MSKMTAEHVEECRAHAATGSATLVDQDFLIALCDLAKLALSPPQDVAALVSELRGLAEKAAEGPWEESITRVFFEGADRGGFDLYHCPKAVETAAYIAAANPVNMTKLLNCVTPLSARNRDLEAENAQMKKQLEECARCVPK